MRRAAQDRSTRREEGSREWDLNIVGDMSTAEILAKLQDLGVPMTTTDFVRQAPKFPSAVLGPFFDSGYRHKVSLI
jgi:hypothetical protein